MDDCVLDASIVLICQVQRLVAAVGIPPEFSLAKHHDISGADLSRCVYLERKKKNGCDAVGFSNDDDENRNNNS